MPASDGPAPVRTGRTSDIIIAHYGIAGSNAEVAAIDLFSAVQHQLKPCKTYSMVFEAVQHGAHYGVVPIENSSEHTVRKVYDLLLDTPVKIVAENIMRIEHCLAATKGTSMAKLRRVHSHPQALAQCSERLGALGLEMVESPHDTASSAKKVAEEGRDDQAAVCNRRAASLYGLDLIEVDIATERNNFTRFIALTQSAEANVATNKTTISFRLEDRQGTLVGALSCFTDNKVNFQIADIRPLRNDRPWEYTYFINCDAGMRSPAMLSSIGELLRKEIKGVKIHGSYVKAKMPG